MILYTIDCPKCKVLEKKLDEKGLTYEKCYDKEKMKSLGFSQTPQLEIDGKIYDFKQAVEWINNN